jgi:hypothetical protein
VVIALLAGVLGDERGHREAAGVDAASEGA